MSLIRKVLLAPGRLLRKVWFVVIGRNLRLIFRRRRSCIGGGNQTSMTVVPITTAVTELAPRTVVEAAHEATSVESAARWRVAGASVTGPHHVRQGRGCDDAAGWFTWRDLAFLVVADGAGSAPRAQLGSCLATVAAVGAAARICLSSGSVTTQDAAWILRSALGSAERRMCDEAAALGVPVRELACTFIAVLATPEFVAALQVGDGAVVIGDGSSALVALTKPSKGEFANETSFLGCNATAEFAMRSMSDIPFRWIGAFTDGIERVSLQMPGGNPHPGFFTPLFTGLRSLAGPEADQALSELLRSERVAARSDDDKTLIVAELL